MCFSVFVANFMTLGKCNNIIPIIHDVSKIIYLKISVVSSTIDRFKVQLCTHVFTYSCVHVFMLAFEHMNTYSCNFMFDITLVIHKYYKMYKTIYHYSLFILLILCLASCRGYKQNIMFKTDGSIFADTLKRAVREAERNYIIRKNDLLSIKVYTNFGESLIDPNMELFKGANRNVQIYEDRQKYLVQDNGFVKLPMVGMVKLDGLILYQADSLLERKYSEFYEDVFCVSRLLNRRVIVLGAIGGHVIPLENENMNILEILALAGGIDNFSKVQNIRLIRGDLKDPDIYVIDLSTIAGMKQANLNVQPNDIIYIEPVRKVLMESIRDISPVIGLVTNIITLILIIVTLGK